MGSEQGAIASPAPFLLPVQGRIITWDEEGNPILASQPVLTAQSVQSAYYAAAARPFVCKDVLDPDFGLYEGLTMAEVIILKQVEGAARSGEPERAEKVMDRLIGKPMARSENLNVNASYEDALRAIAGRASIPTKKSFANGDDALFGDML